MKDSIQVNRQKTILVQDLPHACLDVQRKAFEEMMRTGMSVRRMVVVDGGGYYPTVSVEVIDEFFIDPTSPPPPASPS